MMSLDRMTTDEEKSASIPILHEGQDALPLIVSFIFSGGEPFWKFLGGGGLNGGGGGGGGGPDGFDPPPPIVSTQQNQVS